MIESIPLLQQSVFLGRATVAITDTSVLLQCSVRWDIIDISTYLNSFELVQRVDMPGSMEPVFTSFLISEYKNGSAAIIIESESFPELMGTANFDASGFYWDCQSSCGQVKASEKYTYVSEKNMVRGEVRYACLSATELSSCNQGIEHVASQTVIELEYV